MIRKFRYVFLLLLLFGVSSRAEKVTIDQLYPIKGELFKLTLKIDGGEVEVSRGNRARECFLYVEYNSERIETDVRFHENTDELLVKLDIKDLGFWKKENKDRSWTAKVKIELPTDPDIDLRTEIKAGETKLDLGDLHIQNFILKNWAGEVEVNFDRPNLTKMNIFDVSVKVGEMRLRNLGNANFEEGDINGGIGEMAVDFSGSAFKRSMARIDLDVGETTIVLPRQAGAKLKVSKFSFLSSVEYPNWFEKRGKYYYSENYENADQSIFLMISSGIGELNIRVN
ncbi:hypothetical protein JW935_13035 [candidate division KSB1 bacterium]|nr:hypothetical protein [candidate division KSB1 bacterium]